MKDIPNYEGKYAIDEKGNVWSYKHKKYLKQTESNGYLGVSLIDKQNNKKRHNIHRLVAITYLPNENHLPCVNHKDENKLNNSLENLEWCSSYYNTHYGNCIKKIKATRTKELMAKCHVAASKTLSKAVLCVETGVIYPSAKRAKEILGLPNCHIEDCCKRKRNVAGGVHWQYFFKEAR